MVFDDHTPVLVAEILSSSTQAEDTVRKSTEYLEAGISQYWIVDRAARELVVYGNSARGWESVLVLDDAHPRGTVWVGDYGDVAIDLEALLRP